MRRVLLLSFIPLILASFCTCVNAYEPPGSDGEWDFVVTPYVWLPARSDITSTVDGQTVVAEDVSFKTIADIFDLFALSGRFEAWKGRFGLIGDAMWIKLNTSNKTCLLYTSPSPRDRS